MLLKVFLWGGLLLLFLTVCGFASLVLYGWMEASHYGNLTDTHDLPQRVDTIVAPYVAKRPHVRLAIGVSQRGTRFVKEFGPGEPGSVPSPEGNTMYEIGSVTKVFTGILLAHMEAEGRVTLDQSIATLLPTDVKLPAATEAITLRQLATHTSGLPRLPGNLDVHAIDPYAKYSARDIYQDLRAVKLESVPGKSSAYSNYGMGLLGHLLALKAGKNYDALLDETVCQPLALSDTVMQLSEEQQRRLAPGHTSAGKETSVWNFDVLAGAGALRSDVDDMLTFLEANLRPPDNALGRAMEKAHEVHFSGWMAHQGLAWQIEDDPYVDVRFHWHNGGTGGFVSYIGFIKSQDTAVVVLSNYSDNSDVDEMGLRILRYATKISLE